MPLWRVTGHYRRLFSTRTPYPLSDPKRGTGRRPVHEPDSHGRAVRPTRSTIRPTCSGTPRNVELPRDARRKTWLYFGARFRLDQLPASTSRMPVIKSHRLVGSGVTTRSNPALPSEASALASPDESAATKKFKLNL